MLQKFYKAHNAPYGDGGSKEFAQALKEFYNNNDLDNLEELLRISTDFKWIIYDYCNKSIHESRIPFFRVIYEYSPEMALRATIENHNILLFQNCLQISRPTTYHLRPCLEFACEKGYIDFVSLILNYDHELKDRRLVLSLKCAAYNNRTKIIGKLMKRGAILPFNEFKWIIRKYNMTFYDHVSSRRTINTLLKSSDMCQYIADLDSLEDEEEIQALNEMVDDDQNPEELFMIIASLRACNKLSPRVIKSDISMAKLANIDNIQTLPPHILKNICSYALSYYDILILSINLNMMFTFNINRSEEEIYIKTMCKTHIEEGLSNNIEKIIYNASFFITNHHE